MSKIREKIVKFFEDVGQSMDEVMEAINDEFDDSNFQSSSSNGVTIINSNGDVIIKGKISTLTVNGKKVNLEN